MKAYSMDLRLKIIETYQNEKISQKQLARRFRVSQSFITKLLRRYRETGEIAPLPFGGGVKLKLNASGLATLAELIEKNNDGTLEELCELLKEQTGVAISRATMGRMAQQLKYTWKKKALHPTEKETERVQKLREEYWEKIASIPVEDLVFIDEFGSNLALVRLYGRAVKGQRVRGNRPQKRGKNVSTIGAITEQKVLTFINILGPVDRLCFEAFIVSRLAPLLWEGAHVVLDNSTIHKGKEIEKVLEEVGAKLVFLPAYSPDFNPIENCWSKIKSALRFLKPRNYRELQEAMEKAFELVSPSDIQNWFLHCCYGSSVI